MKLDEREVNGIYEALPLHSETETKTTNAIFTDYEDDDYNPTQNVNNGIDHDEIMDEVGDNNDDVEMTEDNVNELQIQQSDGTTNIQHQVALNKYPNENAMVFHPNQNQRMNYQRRAQIQGTMKPIMGYQQEYQNQYRPMLTNGDQYNENRLIQYQNNRKRSREDDGYEIAFATQIMAPTTYEEAMTRDDREQWENAIKDELLAHEKNETWNIIERKPDMKVIGNT